MTCPSLRRFKGMSTGATFGVGMLKRIPVLLGLSGLLAGGIATAEVVLDTVNQRIKAPAAPEDQVARGSKLYVKQCASCHGPSLNDGEFGPTLKGARFLQAWGDKKSSDFTIYVARTMPVTAPGSLSSAQVADVLAYIYQQNHAATSASPDGGRNEDAAQANAATGGADLASAAGIDSAVELPPPPVVRPSPFDRYTPVRQADLDAPKSQDWLTWRRSSDDQGHSPLKQITPSNVRKLTVKWSWALPNGPNESTPLVHDGVLFAYGFGDVVQAIDAETGDFLWEYAPHSTSGILPGYRKGIALYQDKVITTTSDLHVVALNARTGQVEWDVPLVNSDDGYTLTGGPLIADDKVIIGTGGRVAGGNYIIGLDAATGKETWRFATVQRPDAASLDSWNNLPLEKRSGGAVWTPGSFDARSGLVFFGPSGSYDTAPLRNAVGGPGSNDALYTDATVALDPKTGKLVWHYQHMPNDQWDLDWAFERMVFNAGNGAKADRLVITAGKGAVHDVLDAATGKYRYSFDLGLQDLIIAIDPVTGAKTIDRSRAPGDGTIKSTCPHSNGGKNWLPSAMDPDASRLFVVLNETCMDMVPIEAGQSSLLSTNVRMTLKPRAGSDGRYGRLEAVDLKTRKPVWSARRRAFGTTGALSTAGGVIFAGYMDRSFLAYDAANGRELWNMRLNDVPNSNPISYAVNGKQYVAIVVGGGGPMIGLFAGLVPEIKNPKNRTSTLWVFEVPDK